MNATAVILGIVIALIVVAASAYVIRRSYFRRSEAYRRVITNRDRPAQPEPGEDPATQSPAVRVHAASILPEGEEAVEAAQEEARRRQTGQ